MEAGGVQPDPCARDPRGAAGRPAGGQRPFRDVLRERLEGQDAARRCQQLIQAAIRGSGDVPPSRLLAIPEMAAGAMSPLIAAPGPFRGPRGLLRPGDPPRGGLPQDREHRPPQDGARREPPGDS